FHLAPSYIHPLSLDTGAIEVEYRCDTGATNNGKVRSSKILKFSFGWKGFEIGFPGTPWLQDRHRSVSPISCLARTKPKPNTCRLPRVAASMWFAKPVLYDADRA